MNKLKRILLVTAVAVTAYAGAAQFTASEDLARPCKGAWTCDGD
ncbi:hypothetical protein [Bacillus solimangrovi]|nr:hypothetical protein [Bacillus solimangrovi]